MEVVIDPGRRRGRVSLEEERIVVLLPAREEVPAVRHQRIKELLERWMINMAHSLIPARVMYYEPMAVRDISDQERRGLARQTSFGRVNQIRIKDQKTRWGSCSSKNNLNFSWRLIMAPERVLDYVVVHELCHLTHMNHGKEFWALVESVMPDYKDCKKWLRENEKSLTLP